MFTHQTTHNEELIRIQFNTHQISGDGATLTPISAAIPILGQVIRIEGLTSILRNIRSNTIPCAGTLARPILRDRSATGQERHPEVLLEFGLRFGIDGGIEAADDPIPLHGGMEPNEIGTDIGDHVPVRCTAFLRLQLPDAPEIRAFPLHPRAEAVKHIGPEAGPMGPSGRNREGNEPEGIEINQGTIDRVASLNHPIPGLAGEGGNGSTLGRRGSTLGCYALEPEHRPVEGNDCYE